MMSAKEPPVKVLFVDEELEIRQALSALLQGESYEVLTAASGEEGLAILKNTDNIGVIVSDQTMPAMNGIEFLKRAWELSPDSLRIMLTGQGGLELEHEALYKGGAFRFISKPWKNEELKKGLREAVATYMLIRENRRMTTCLSLKASEKAERHREKTLRATT
jgi:DNA-binding NtrC family response regulator